MAEKSVRDKRQNEKKTTLLGLPIGTATARLRKSLMFALAQKCGMDVCHRCGKLIETVVTISIDHKMAWQSAADPVSAFYDIDNIAFSHHSCNVRAASRPHRFYGNETERLRARWRRQGKTRQASPAWVERRRLRRQISYQIKKDGGAG